MVSFVLLVFVVLTVANRVMEEKVVTKADVVEVRLVVWAAIVVVAVGA
ncbi:MAG: hypothetical protein QXG32_00340 [Candidatus Bathyarchaeia archaeon]